MLTRPMVNRLTAPPDQGGTPVSPTGCLGWSFAEAPVWKPTAHCVLPPLVPECGEDDMGTDEVAAWRGRGPMGPPYAVVRRPDDDPRPAASPSFYRRGV